MTNYRRMQGGLKMVLTIAVLVAVVTITFKSAGYSRVMSVRDNLLGYRDEGKSPVASTITVKHNRQVDAKDGKLNPAASSAGYIGQCQLQNVSVSEEECTKYDTEELEDVRTFPLHHVSGAPGSGNDWISWLASPTRYTWNLHKRQVDCEVYNRQSRNKRAYEETTTTCIFLKSHEPWFKNYYSNYTVRSVLLLRHPIDAVFAEYKRQLGVKAGVNKRTEQMKSSTRGQTADKFIDVKTNKTEKAWKERLEFFISKWLNHTTYWLTEYPKPVHVLLYNSVKVNTTQEVEEMQKFFGYKFDGLNFRRHCCVMSGYENKNLIRKHGPVDKYKDYAYETEPEIKEMVDDAVSKVGQMLDKKFPNSRYRLTRG